MNSLAIGRMAPRYLLPANGNAGASSARGAHNSHTSLTFFSPVSKMFVSLQPNINPKNHKKMAKIYGLFGSMTGKLADTVMSVRNGEQLARKYQPIVSNPSTPAQVAVRAKLKLLSQLSAAYAPIIAIKRRGSVSARNLFTKRNFELANYANNQADITLADVQLTNSAVPLAGFTIDRSGTNMELELSDNMGNSIDRVVYVVVKKTSGQELLVADSKVVEFSEGAGTFPTTMPKVTGAIVVMAYGIRLNTEAARIAFGNMTAPTAQEVARLLVTMTNADTALTLTETRGLQLAAADQSGETTGTNMVTITPMVSSAGRGTGTVSGGGRVAAGTSVTVTATPAGGNRFDGWFSADGTSAVGSRLSQNPSYTFVAGETSMSVYAVFNGEDEG